MGADIDGVGGRPQAAIHDLYGHAVIRLVVGLPAPTRPAPEPAIDRAPSRLGCRAGEHALDAGRDRVDGPHEATLLHHGAFLLGSHSNTLNRPAAGWRGCWGGSVRS